MEEKKCIRANDKWRKDPPNVDYNITLFELIDKYYIDVKIAKLLNRAILGKRNPLKYKYVNGIFVFNEKQVVDMFCLTKKEEV